MAQGTKESRALSQNVTIITVPLCHRKGSQIKIKENKLLTVSCTSTLLVVYKCYSSKEMWKKFAAQSDIKYGKTLILVMF